MICDNCGHFNDEGAKFCEKCAEPLLETDEEEVVINEPLLKADEEAVIINETCEEEEIAEPVSMEEDREETEQITGFLCNSCGKMVENNMAFCRFCGARLNREKEPETEEVPFKNEEKKENSKSIILYIVALIITIFVCTGLTAFMIFASTVAKNEKYGIEEKEIFIEETEDIEEEKEEISEEIKEEEEKQEKEEVKNTYNYPEPVYEKITASSFIPDKMGLKYSPDMTIDNNSDTAWNEGVEGEGIGEWIEFSSKKKQYVTGINILNGYCKSETLYYENHRPRTIEIKFDSMSVERELDDVYNVYQNIEFAEPVESKRVRIIIKDLYRGTEYDDCCISEIGIY